MIGHTNMTNRAAGRLRKSSSSPITNRTPIAFITKSFIVDNLSYFNILLSARVIGIDRFLRIGVEDDTKQPFDLSSAFGWR
jgi:hypothetical protein